MAPAKSWPVLAVPQEQSPSKAQAAVAAASGGGSATDAGACCGGGAMSSRQRRVCWAASAALLLAAVVAVAVAVPVTAAAASSSSSSTALASQQRQINEAGTRSAPQQQPADAPMCQGVRGLCAAPVRLVMWPGTHNSASSRTAFPTLSESQRLTFEQQLQAGARLFDLDVTAGNNGAGPLRFGHCSGCFCAFSTDPTQNDPAKVFAVMGSFLASNPREVIVLGLSNINCGDKAAARAQLLAALAASPLGPLLATQPITQSTTLGDLVDSGQRAVLLFYDQWVTPAGYSVGSKFVPNQPLWRIYGEQAAIDAKDSPAAIDAQTAQRLLADVVRQLAGAAPGLSLSTPWRVVGLFASQCFVCRASGVCGAASCAEQANKASFVLYLLGKATARWTRSRAGGGAQGVLLPAFNGLQVDYLQHDPLQDGSARAAGQRGSGGNVVAAARQLNEAVAALVSTQPGAAAQLGLANCAWVLDDVAAAGGLVCVHHGRRSVPEPLGQPASVQVAAAGGRRRRQLLAGQDEAGASTSRHVLLPANPALLLRIFGDDGKLRREVRGTPAQAQLLDLSVAAQELQLLWQAA